MIAATISNHLWSSILLYYWNILDCMQFLAHIQGHRIQFQVHHKTWGALEARRHLAMSTKTNTFLLVETAIFPRNWARVVLQRCASIFGEEHCKKQHTEKPNCMPSALQFNPRHGPVSWKMLSATTIRCYNPWVRTYKRPSALTAARSLFSSLPSHNLSLVTARPFHFQAVATNVREPERQT